MIKLYYKLKNTVLYLIMCILFSCKTEFPENLNLDLETYLSKNETNIVNFFLAYEDIEYFTDCVTKRSKEDFSDYKDFLKEVSSEKSNYLKSICKQCIIDSNKLDYEIFFFNLMTLSLYDNFYLYLEKNEIKKYEESFEIKLKGRFPSIYEFLEVSFNNPDRFEAIINGIDKSVGEEILKAREISKNLKLTEIEVRSAKYGFTPFVIENQLETEIKSFCFVYYFIGQNWEGWVSNGKYLIPPKTTKHLSVPKSINGKVGNLIYYTGTYFNEMDGLLYGFQGDGTFLVDKIKNEFLIFNANDLSESNRPESNLMNSSFRMHAVNSEIEIIHIGFK